MLPLLSYKLYRYKKDMMMKQDNKLKTSNGMNNQSHAMNQRKKNKNPSLTEITILLFGMFGVPVFYFCYWTLISIYHWTIAFNTEQLLSAPPKSVSMDTAFNPFYFNPLSISIKEIIENRLVNMKKYKFNYSWTDIDRRGDLSMEEYRDIYSGKWPVIITDCGIKWPAMKKWTKSYFMKSHGRELVTVKTMADGVSENFAMPLDIYMQHLHKGYPKQWTYLNDELFIPSRPKLQSDLGTCKEIMEDYFQMFPVEIRPWWSFLLWGTRYSRSHLHMDPYNWTGTNMLFPPGQDNLLHVKLETKYKFPININKYNSKIDCFDPNAHIEYPSLKSAKVLEFYQYPGELLIIPTGWFHQAFNEEITLAVAGQLMNSENYLYVLEEIFKGGDLQRGPYYSDLKNKSPQEKVKEVLFGITEKTRTQGREATEFIYNQLKQLAESSGLPAPPSILDLINSQKHKTDNLP